MLQEAVLAYFKVLSRNFSGGVEDNSSVIHPIALSLYGLKYSGNELISCFLNMIFLLNVFLTVHHELTIY